MADEAPDDRTDAEGWISSCGGDFLLLVERYLDGAATADELARLQQALLASPVHRDAFVQLATIAGSLTEHFAPARCCAELEHEIDRLSQSVDSNRTIANPETESPIARAGQAPASPLLAFVGATIRLVPGGEFTVGSLLIAAVVGAFVGLASLVWKTREDVERLAQQRGQGSAAAQASAQVVATRDCRWLSAEPRLGAPVEGKLLRVAAGVAELTLAQGVQVAVEGPAMFEVVAPDRVRLDRGRLAATVPPQGVGFTVVTPTAEVVDLGTQFGIEVDGSERTDVHVLKGVVAVKARSAPQESNPVEPVRLSAGQAVRMSKSALAAPIAADAARFSRVLEWHVSSAVKTAGQQSPAAKVGRSFAEDFQSGTPGPHLALGPDGASPTVDFSQGTFAITSGPGSRIYLGTQRGDYALEDFVLEATIILPTGSNPWSDAFLGLGSNRPAGSVFEPAGPSVLAVIRLDDQTANGFETRDNRAVAVEKPSAGVELSPKLGGKTVRLRMNWDGATRQARFELDTDYAGGPMQPTYSLAVDGSDNGFDASNSQLIFGGGFGLQFDDVQVGAPGLEASGPQAAEQ